MYIKKYQETWDLEGLFPGGSDSSKFREHIAISIDEIDKLSTYVHKFEPLKEEAEVEALREIVGQFEIVVKKSKTSRCLCQLFRGTEYGG